MDQAKIAQEYSESFVRMLIDALELSKNTSGIVTNSLETISNQSDAISAMVSKSNDLHHVIEKLKM